MVGWADVLLALEELRVKTLQDVAEAELEMTALCKDLRPPKAIQTPERDELFLFASSSRCCVLGPPYLQCSCCCSITKLCPTLCDLMDCSTPGFPVLHYLPEFAQIHVH